MGPRRRAHGLAESVRASAGARALRRFRARDGRREEEEVPRPVPRPRGHRGVRGQEADADDTVPAAPVRPRRSARPHPRRGDREPVGAARRDAKSRRGLGGEERFPRPRRGGRAFAHRHVAHPAGGRQCGRAEQDAQGHEVDDGLRLRKAEVHERAHRPYGRRGRCLRGGLPEGARGGHGLHAVEGGKRCVSAPRVLIAEPLSRTGLAVLSKEGLSADVRTDLSREALLAAIGDYDALVVRSATQVDRELLTAGKKLRVVGRAGVGLDNVDVKAATERGVLVVNAPSGNVVSAAEHAIALLLALLRKIPEAQASLKAGEWKRTKFVGTELQGKTVGLVGLGQVGTRVAARLRPWQVTLLAFDPYVTPERTAELGVTPVSLDELLAKSDIVSLHAPGGSETKHLIGERQLAAMKEGAILVNCARGPLVDEAALVNALDSGHLAGAAIDVFSVEPPKDFSLMKHPKVLCTPHLGASTVEAQDRVAVETVEMLAEALKGSPFVAADNLPFPSGGDPHAALPWMRLAETVGAFVGQAMPEAPKQLTVTLAGIPEAIRKACVVAAVKGVVSTFAEGVNIVNAVSLAKLNGISVSDSVREDAGGYASLVTVAAGDRSASGTLFGDRLGRMVGLDGLSLEFSPEGTLLVIANRDVPGVVGRIGTLLGSRGVNISDLALARGRDGRAAAVVRIDRPDGAIGQDLVRAGSTLEGSDSARLGTLRGGRGAGAP